MPPDPPASSGTPEAQDALTALTGWFSSVFDDLIRALADAEGGPLLLDELGFTGTAPVLPTVLLQRLDQASQGGGGGTGSSTSGTSAGAGASRVDTLAGTITAIAVLIDAVAEVAGGAGGATVAAELVADMIDVVLELRLRETHPGWWAVLRMLNLLNDGGFQLANAGDLMTDIRTYLSGLATGGGFAQTYQDYSAAILGTLGTLAAFVPPVGDPHDHTATGFHTEVTYGWSPATVLDHPNLAMLLTRMLTVRLACEAAFSTSDNNSGMEQVIDVTAALVPPEHNAGHQGVFFRIDGATSITVPLGTGPRQPDDDPAKTAPPSGWQLKISVTNGTAAEILAAANGFLHTADSGFTFSIALERPPDVDGAWLIGPADGMRVEIQHARLAATWSTDDAGALFDIAASADHIVANIPLGGDGLIRSLLPPSLRVDTQLDVGSDSRRGFYLNGGVALVVDLPVHLATPPVYGMSLVLQGLHLRLGVDSAGPQDGKPADATVSASLLADASLSIGGGTFTLSVAGIGARWALRRGTPDSTTAGRWHPTLAPVRPTGIGIAIKTDQISGGGFIGYDPDRGEYSGALAMHITAVSQNGKLKTFDLSALGMLDTRIPGHDDDWALLIIVSALFTPGLNIGGTAAITGVGVVYGYNHSADSDAIGAGLRTKALDAIVFPPDPVAQAPHIFSVWRQVLPVVDGATVVGLMLKITWGGAVEAASLELALLLTFGAGPTQVLLLGSLRISLPHPQLPLVHLRADILGRMTFDPFEILIEAALIDSTIATFPVSGGLVLVARPADNTYLLSIGGFHPHYTAPSGVPAADRLRIDISGSNNPRLRMESYFAITSQTFQYGGRTELHAAAGPLAVDGWFGWDALIAWLPHFRFSAEVSAGLSLSFDGSPVMEVSIDVLFEGPGPWHVKGYASLSLLFVTLSLPIDHTWGQDAGPTATIAQPITLVHEALSAPDAWSAPPPAGTSGLVALKPPAGTALAAHPLSAIGCQQRIVPLGLQVTHLGGQPLAAPTTVDITALLLDGVAAPGARAVADEFATGQFLDLTDDQALSRPSFEPMRAGLQAGGDSVDIGSAAAVATTYKTVAVGDAGRVVRPRWTLPVTHADAVLRPGAPQLARPLPGAFTTLHDTLRATAGATPQPASLAAQSATGRLFDQVGLAGVSS